MVRYLDIEVVASELAELGFRVRDYGLLGSALARPRTTVFGVDAYPTIESKAAALVESVVQHHVMFDGNKRAAWYLLVAFLLINEIEIEAKDAAVVRLMDGISTNSSDLAKVARWIAARSHRTNLN